jgi:hypothetical protein
LLEVGWKVRHNNGKDVHDNEVNSAFVAKDLAEHVFDGQSKKVKRKHVE